MSCSNGQVWSSKWPPRSLTKPVKLGTPRAPSALPGVSESGHEAAWPHRFAKKSEGLKVIDLANIMHKAFDKASNYTINRPEKLRYPGHIISIHIPWNCDHASCFISCFTALCKLCWSKFGHSWNRKLWPPLVFRPPRCWESHDFNTLQAHGSYSQHRRACMLLSSFKQANSPTHFQAVRFAGAPLEDVSKLGTPRWWIEVVNQWIWGPWSFETPGKTCFTSPIPSTNKAIILRQFRVVCPPGCCESTLSTTPKTLRKVIPVKGYWQRWETEYWIKLGKLWVNIPGPKMARRTIIAGYLGNLFQMFIDFSISIWLQASKCFFLYVGWILGKLPQDCWIVRGEIDIFQLHGAFSTTTLLQVNK